MARLGPHSEPVLTIAQLVQAHLDNGRTLRQLEDDSGGVVAYTQFDKISKGQITQWPRSSQAIEAMAHALDVDARQIVMSFAAQFGIDVREQRSTLASMLPAGTDRLSTKQARAVAALVRAIVEEDSEAGLPARRRSDVDLAARDVHGNGETRRKSPRRNRPQEDSP